MTTGDDGADEEDVVDPFVAIIAVLEFFFKIGGLMILSLDDEDLLLGSLASIAVTFLLITSRDNR